MLAILPVFEHNINNIFNLKWAHTIRIIKNRNVIVYELNTILEVKRGKRRKIIIINEIDSKINE